MIAFIRKLREQGDPLKESIINGAVGRLRPVLMTALVLPVLYRFLHRDHDVVQLTASRVSAPARP